MERDFGFILSFDAERGFGFISWDDAPDISCGLFFHRENVNFDGDGEGVCEAGQRVSFVIGPGSRSAKNEAFDVRFESVDDVLGETGTVRRWRTDGYGFISPDDGGEDIFAHKSSLIQIGGVNRLAAGMRVWFQRSERTKNKRVQAVNIMPTQDNNYEIIWNGNKTSAD